MKVRIQENAYIYGVLLLLLVPLRWLLAWLIGVFIHELFHYIAVKVLSGNISLITIDIHGITMETEQLSDGKRIVAILSGPIFGCLPVFSGGSYPELAICCWVLSVYNMLPLTGLDGGNVLSVLIKNKIVINWIERVVLTLFFTFGIYCTFVLQLGIIPLLIVTGLFFRSRKKPCKEGCSKVQ